MYLHVYQQFCPEDSVQIICNKKAAADLIYALARALSTETEEQVTLACKDGKFYCLKVKIDENITNNNSVKLPYICDSNIGMTMMLDKSSECIDVSNIPFELDGPDAGNILYEEESDMSNESPF